MTVGAKAFTGALWIAWLYVQEQNLALPMNLEACNFIYSENSGSFSYLKLN